MYLTYNDLIARLPVSRALRPSSASRPRASRLMLLTEKQALCAKMGLSNKYYLSDNLMMLPAGCKVQRGFEVLPDDHVAQSDLYKYLTFHVEGQIYIIPVKQLVDPYDMLDPLA